MSPSPAADYPPEYVEHHDLLVHGEQPEAESEEHEFFIEMLDQHLPVQDPLVLAAGCAAGRHALGLLRRGVQLELQDDSAALRAEARRRLGAEGIAAPVHDARLEDLARAGDARLDAMLLLSSALLRGARVDERLAAARRLLKPGGLLVADNANFLAQWDLYGRARRYHRPIDGGRLWVTERLEMDSLACTVEARVDGVVERAGTKRFFQVRDTFALATVAELRLRLEAAGLELLLVTTDYEEHLPPSDPNGEQVQLVARLEA